ncbi:sensor histidine kinase [Kocuria rosea]|uniref:sensor histidine kinase n=1 Tax=Kocuria rosea TaxID=1275 RepID=UPI00232C2585|nr:histidine kinase [Kocuria rosea]WJZ68610.1 histidine kinase [Kocuria rosea]
MRQWDVERWFGFIVVLIAAGTGLPALLGAGGLLLPWPLWAGSFAAVFVAVAALGKAGTRKRQLVLYVVAVLLSWLVVLTASDATFFLLTLLIFVAGAGTDLLRLPMSLVVVGLNTVVSVIAARMIVPEGLLPLGVGAFYLLIQLSVVFGLHILRREQVLRAELAEAYVGLRATDAILGETARSAERLRIARELHDLLGHQLTLLTLRLEAAKHSGPEVAGALLDRADGVARSLLTDVRETVSELRTGQVAGLADTLSDIGKDIPGLDVAIELTGDVDVDEEQRLLLLRAVQEIVTNTLRHAEARELSIQIEGDTERIRLTAGDDGRGAIPFVAGNGLQGLAERFAQAGGNVEFAGEHGFQVRAWMPTR